MRKGLLVVLMVSALNAPQAVAQEWYVAARAGQTMEGELGASPSYPITDETTYAVGLGRKVGAFRFELGAAQMAGNANVRADIDVMDYSAMAYFDVPLGERASLFVGAGGGYIDGEVVVNQRRGNFQTFDIEGEGWRLAAGGAYRLTNRIVGEIQYKHSEADTDLDDLHLEFDAITLGARVHF